MQHSNYELAARVIVPETKVSRRSKWGHLVIEILTVRNSRAGGDSSGANVEHLLKCRILTRSVRNFVSKETSCTSKKSYTLRFCGRLIFRVTFVLP